jgi:Tfp pilus assembly protein PilF
MHYVTGGIRAEVKMLCLIKLRFQQGDISTAAQCAGAVLKQVPEHPQAMHLRALISFRSGELEPAAQIWRRRVRIWTAHGSEFPSLL